MKRTVSGQRRMVFAALVPLAALAAIALQETILPAVERSRLAARLGAIGYRPQRLAGLLLALVVACASLSNLILLTGAGASAATGQANLAQPVAVEEAIAWLGEHSASDAVILSSFRVGNIIPARIGRRVVWGHWAQTAFYDQKEVDVTAFFATETTDTTRQATLVRYGVTHSLYGPAERALGDFDPSRVGYLEAAYHSGDVVVYRTVGMAGRD